MLNTGSVQPEPEDVKFQIVSMPVGGDARITCMQEIGPGIMRPFAKSGKKLRDGNFRGNGNIISVAIISAPERISCESTTGKIAWNVR